VPPEGVRQTGMAYVVSVTPDVCLTPMGATAIPVPYPIIGIFENAALLAMSVRMCGRPTFTTASQVTKVMGDEAGTAGGVASGKNMSICESVTASSTVKAEGNQVLRHGDVLKMNNGNTLGTVIFMPGVGPIIVGKSSEGGGGYWHGFKNGVIALLKASKGVAKNAVLGPVSTAYDSFKMTSNLVEHPAALIQPYTEAYHSGGVSEVLGRATPDILMQVFGGKAGGVIEGLSSAEAAATTEMDAAAAVEMDAEPHDTEPMDAVEPDDTVEMDTAPEPEGTDGLTVTGASAVQFMEILDTMLSGLSEEVNALVRKSPSLSEQLIELSKQGWDLVQKEGGGFAKRDIKEMSIPLSNSAAQDVSITAHEAGHAAGPAPPDLPKGNLSEQEYVDQNLNENFLDEGRAQYNAVKVRDEIRSNGGDDIGIPGDNPRDYLDPYNASKNGLVDQDQAIQDMADAMRNETVGNTGKPYPDYYGNAARDRYNRL
jgi:hypothetical protein